MKWYFKEINMFLYIYLNFFCRSVIRNGKGKILPYRGAVVDIEKSAKIQIYDENISIGVNKLRGSKAETFIRLRNEAVWNAEEGCEISYGSTIEILANAKLNSKLFSMNSFSTLVVGKGIELGHDVMIARNVVIYDSDFHSIESADKKTNKAADIKIGNHVWIATNSIILKGVTIEDNSVVSANTLVVKDVAENVLVGNKKKLVVLRDNIRWKR